MADMLIAKPAPEEKIRELAALVVRAMPETCLDSFLLPRDENCNRSWNTVSTRNSAYLLEWLAHEEGISTEAACLPGALLSDLLDGIVGSPQHTVVMDGEVVPVSIEYLTCAGNWISNFTAVSILQAVSRYLGPDYADPNLGLSLRNPWLRIARYTAHRTAEEADSVQKLAALKDGARAVYLELASTAAFFNRTTIYQVVNDLRLGRRRRRIRFCLYHTNLYYLVPEMVGWNAAVYSYVPQIFSQHPLLRAIPGFDLMPADVTIDFPEGDYSGSWEITADYDITPIDRVRSWFNVGELQETVATLSAEVLELQRDRKALSEEAEQLAGQLIEAEKLAAVGRLSFGVGHDLRNTLATAINSGIPLSRLIVDLQQVIDMLEQEKLVDEIAEYLSRRKIHLRLSTAPDLYLTMMNSLSQALENVKALEGYAVQDGSDFQQVRIEQVIERVLVDYRRDLTNIQVDTTFEVRGYCFQGNFLKVYDIFQNLVLNALDALEEAGKPVLRIATQARDGFHKTTVEDNGCGMSEEELSHAFEPFYTTKDLAEGRQRGLGLFNVWRLVEQHGGTVEIESELDQFTRFSVRFPIGT